MTELEIHRPQAPVPAQPASGYDLIRTTAQAMGDAHAIAKAIANTDMVPKHFRSKPDDLTAAILYGATLGFDPMQSARQVYVIHGQAALYARAMTALVLAAGHEVWTEASSPEAVTVAGRRRGSQHIERSTWDMDRAKRADYTSNAKYRTNPEEMLYAKAASEVCRKVAPDVLNGVYAVEEMEMEAPTVTAEQVRPTSQDALRAALSRTNPPVVAEQVQPEAEEPANAADGITPPQLKMLGALMREAGITGRNEALAYVGDVIGRAVESRNDLTKAEASVVIDELGREVGEQAASEA